MRKPTFNQTKQILAILLVVLFVVSLTGVTVSAKGGSYWRGYGGWGGYPWWGYGYPYQAYPADTGLPYMMSQYPAPATSIQARAPVASTQASAPA
jgi:hypothetical protein